jgi:hypothetical protein
MTGESMNWHPELVEAEAKRLGVTPNHAENPLNLEIVNRALALKEQGCALGVYDLEHLVGCRTLHAFLAVLNRHCDGNAIPKRLNSTDYAILYGKMKEEDKHRATVYQETKKGQKRLSEWGI